MSHQLITTEEFKEVMPAHVRKNISPAVVNNINNAIKDPEILAVYRENVVGLASVMKEGKFKIDSYLSAVQFVSRKLLGDTQVACWAKTFPDRYNAMIQAGKSKSEIAAVCSRYASSKLVVLLLGQTMMPTHILNAPLYQEALNTQATLMRTADSEKVRTDAANSLINALKPPETKKIELDIGLKEDSSIQTLRETTLELARQQQRMIQDGSASVETIANSKLISHTDIEEGELIK